MKKTRSIRYASLASLAATSVILTACGGGGGGVNSTPTPTPTPTPSPTPTPNSDLIAPLTSESFANDASLGTISVSKLTGSATQDAGATSFDISYNSGTDSYSVTDGSLSRTFGRTSIDPSQSNDRITTYKIVNGTTTDFLTLTTPGTGTGQTRYVGAGFWQRVTEDSSSVNGRFDAFAYGVQTPNSAVPRTGAASYDVQMLGASTFVTNVFALAGNGRLDVDFGSGGIYGKVNYTETNIQTGATNFGGVMTAAAMIDAASNSFTGSLSLSGGLDSELHGSFYGPGAEEVGAAFSSEGANAAIVGAIWGARSSYPLNQSTSLTQPENATFFTPLSASIKGTRDNAGRISAAAADAPIKAFYIDVGVPRLVYRTSARIDQYLFAGNDPSYTDLSFGQQYLVAGLQWDGRSATGVADSYVYGQNTSTAAMPRTGSASFDLSLGGIVMPANATMQSLEGRGSLKADFATGAITALGGYTVHDFSSTNLSGGGSAVTGSGTWTGGATVSANGFAGTMTLDGSLTYMGTLKGGFFGPGAEEVGGIMQASSATGGQLIAELHGKRGDDISASQLGLLGLTSTTVLKGSEAQFNYIPDLSPPESTFGYSNIDVTYDPSANSYMIRNTTTGINFGNAIPANVTIAAADRSASESDAKFDVYHGANYDARIYRPGTGNPEIALTYTSFAQFDESGTVDGRTVDASHYVAFGARTPQFQVPTTGTATYSGVVYGRGKDGRFSSDAVLSGSSMLTANFGTGGITMSMDLTSTDRSSGASRALGTAMFSTQNVVCSGCGSPTFSLFATQPGQFTGSATGQFNGPNAAEFAANFLLQISSTTGQAGDSSSFVGVTLGKKD
jgi:hypothetical protein